ncbi:MAG TPA: helix-turn-helix transcriptional regulator [Herpetosiphonaceae bacterium]
MRQNLSASISLNDMAEIAHFSPCYFNQLFCSITGIPPSRFLTALRLEAAKRLLLDTNLRIVDVCYEVGYNSLGTFSSRFTQLVGVSPHGFRELARPDNWRHLDAFLGAMDRPFPPVFRSHKQTAVGRIHVPSSLPTDTAFGFPARRRSLSPVFIGLYTLPMPQGKPVAYTVALESPIYMLPRVPDGRYYVFATSFQWSEDPKSYLLLDGKRDDLLVGRGDRPLVVRNGRYQNHSDLHMRSLQPTDPPLLTTLFYFMLQSRQMINLLAQRS